MPCQFILHMHEEHNAADYATDHAKFLTHDKQGLIRNAVKTAPMNTASELIKNVQDSSTKKINPKLKESVACLFRHECAKLLTVVCNGVELNSEISSLKTLVDKIFIKDAILAHIHGLSIGAPQFIDCFKTFCIGKVFVGFALVSHNSSTASRHVALARSLSGLSYVQ